MFIQKHKCYSRRRHDLKYPDMWVFAVVASSSWNKLHIQPCLSKKEILGQFPSVNYKHLSLTLTYLSVVVFLQKLSQELRVRLLLERDLCFCLNKKVLLVSKKVVDVTLELPQRVTLQPLQPCRGCRLRRSTGPIPALLESMSHLPTKICKK